MSPGFSTFLFYEGIIRPAPAFPCASPIPEFISSEEKRGDSLGRLRSAAARRRASAPRSLAPPPSSPPSSSRRRRRCRRPRRRRRRRRRHSAFPRPSPPRGTAPRRLARVVLAGGRSRGGAGIYRLSSASSSRSRFPIVDGDDDIRDNVRGRRNGARTGGDDTAATTTAARGGGNSPPRRNEDRTPRLPLHRRPPAAGHAASRRCNPNGRSIPLPPPTPRHGPSSPFAIVNARTGGTETAAAQGGLALRILAQDKRGEGRAMTMI